MFFWKIIVIWRVIKSKVLRNKDDFKLFNLLLSCVIVTIFHETAKVSQKPQCLYSLIAEFRDEHPHHLPDFKTPKSANPHHLPDLKTAQERTHITYPIWKHPRALTKNTYPIWKQHRSSPIPPTHFCKQPQPQYHNIMLTTI